MSSGSGRNTIACRSTTSCSIPPKAVCWSTSTSIRRDAVVPPRLFHQVRQERFPKCVGIRGCYDSSLARVSRVKQPSNPEYIHENSVNIYLAWRASVLLQQAKRLTKDWSHGPKPTT